MNQPRKVITFVEILEDRREDLGLFVGERDSFIRSFHKLPTTCCLEEWRVAEDVFVCSKQPLFSSDDQCDYGGGQSTGGGEVSDCEVNAGGAK